MLLNFDHLIHYFIAQKSYSTVNRDHIEQCTIPITSEPYLSQVTVIYQLEPKVTGTIIRKYLC